MATSREIVVHLAAPKASLSSIAMACEREDGRDGGTNNALVATALVVRLVVVRDEEERDRACRSEAWYASAVERLLQLLLAAVASSSGWAGATLLPPRRARMKPIFDFRVSRLCIILY